MWYSTGAVANRAPVLVQPQQVSSQDAQRPTKPNKYVLELARRIIERTSRLENLVIQNVEENLPPPCVLTRQVMKMDN